MKHPLRSLAMFTLGLLCLSACHAAVAGNSASLRAFPSWGDAAPRADSDSVIIPGPLRSFLRMAGISQEASAEDVLPLLARNVYLRGYQAGRETEFLLLLNSYVHYARELQLVAGAEGKIRVADCDDAIKLISLLGYEFEQTCGQKNAYLQTANAERAFLTTDSGFPLTALEEAMQKHTPFTYTFPATRIPVLFHQNDWIAASLFRTKGGTNLIDVLLHDQNLDRLYWAFSKSDQETQSALRQSLPALLPLAPAFDFYGSQICIHAGRVLVPGGAGTERSWEDLVGASVTSPTDFVIRLLAKDQGWLAAYFDALSRVSSSQQIRLTEESRLKRLYDAYRKPMPGSSATKGVFPRNADLLMLFIRMQWQPDGAPYVPGTLGAWDEILTQNWTPDPVRGWVKREGNPDSPEHLLLSLVACSRFDTDSGPVQIYLMLSAIDVARTPGAPLSDTTIRLLADNFSQLHSWYLIFSEFPALNDGSITLFVKAAEAANRIDTPMLRANAMGALQANVGLWQIVARQHQIPGGKINQSWGDVVQPFAAISSSIQLFDATRSSLSALSIAINGDASPSQDEMIEMLAGPPQDTEPGRSVHDVMAERLRSVLDDQQLVSLDTLFELYDGLDAMARGAQIRDHLIQLAGNLREFEMPRPIFTPSEKISWAPGIYTSRHAELQIRTDLTKVIERGSAAQLEAARGQLTPFLRDTLVGLNYAYYEPPGAQALHYDPLFVRSHDFSGASIEGYHTVWDPPELIGVGVPAGGGAYLIGSLADLPYALALTEEDFIAPENVQALIWRTAVPALLVSAIEPRWWSVSAKELHAVTLYQRCGEELLVASMEKPELRRKVIEILSDVMTSKQLEMTEQSLTHAGEAAILISQITPAAKFYLAEEFRKEFPADAASSGAAGRELDNLVRSDPSESDAARLARDFGVPHPIMAQTNACGLLYVKPFPAFSGSAYRLMGESWESTNLYWARIADEMGYAPATLNLLIPELTRQMVARIFATDVGDWPALLRAMDQTGNEFRNGQLRIAISGASIRH